MKDSLNFSDNVSIEVTGPEDAVQPSPIKKVDKLLSLKKHLEIIQQLIKDLK